MDRKTFLKYLSLTPLIGTAMNIKDFGNIIAPQPNSEKMPVIFIGHGSPMNAITDNAYGKSWGELGRKLSPPKAILCISAHWLTSGTAVAMTDKPKTIHDFGGFPEALFKVEYPAPGAAQYAKMAIDSIHTTKVHEDFEWGLDHGAWSVLKHMYPNADIPVFQMSIDYGKPPAYHYNLAKELGILRRKGILIVSSGNVVHNLRMLRWQDNSAKPFDWAIEFDELVRKSIEENNAQPLIEYQKLGQVATLAHPTNDHYLPLMYTLGLREKEDDFSFFNNTFEMGSLSMRSVLFG